jgi:plastocyanin
MLPAERDDGGSLTKCALVRLALLVLLVAAPACHRSGAGAASCPNPSSTIAVKLADFDFDPSCVVANRGTTLTLRDTGNAPHTYTVAGTQVNVKLDPGATQTVTLKGLAPGTYTVICEFHPQMRGALQVK